MCQLDKHIIAAHVACNAQEKSELFAACKAVRPAWDNILLRTGINEHEGTFGGI